MLRKRVSHQEVADKYIAAFREDVMALVPVFRDRHPRVVELMVISVLWKID